MTQPLLKFCAAQVKILGHSGKFTVTRTLGNISSWCMVTMDALRELDHQGQQVGTSGSVKHSINTFASQDVTFTPHFDEQVSGHNVN